MLSGVLKIKDALHRRSCSRLISKNLVVAPVGLMRTPVREQWMWECQEERLYSESFDRELRIESLLVADCLVVWQCHCSWRTSEK